MFDSALGNGMGTGVSRRAFLTGVAASVGGLTLWSWKQSRGMPATAAVAAFGTPKEVTIVQFSDSGERLKKVKVAKVVKTDDEWRKQLGSGAFEITRHADTEIAFTGKYWRIHEKGLYRCIGCDNALFDSSTKFDSGTGWPSFWAPIASENVIETRDVTFGMIRTAVSCKECDAHLGHLFDDGPAPTGLRYCLNSASLRFVPRT